MLLRGNLREFSLPNILQLVSMSVKTGALTIRGEDQSGCIFFRRGSICYASEVPQHLPLGERLVRDGAITTAQLRRALVAQKEGVKDLRIGAILLADGVLDRPTLEHAVREQIQATVYDFFGWPDADFEFAVDEQVADEDVLVELHVESVIMEGCRRIDEWERFIEHIGSMERIPHLTDAPQTAGLGEISLTAEEWRAIAHVDGRADINTILRDCGLDRFHGAKVMYGLHSRGLISVSEPVIENLGRTLSVAVRGPIDIYNEVFLSTVTDGSVVQQLRVEIIDDKEVEIPLLAGQVSLEGDAGEDGVLIFTASASASDEAWTRVAGQSTAWIVLANANDIDSLRSTRLDLEFVRGLGHVPLVVGTYVSMADDEFSCTQVAEILGLDAAVPVIPFHLRDRDSASAVLRCVLQSISR